MSDHEAGNPAVHVTPTEIRSAQYRELYANFSRVTMTPWDLGVMFGTVNDSIPGQPPSITTDALVRMSPHQFKIFVNALSLIIAAWEDRFGKLDVASQFMLSAGMVHDVMDKAAQQMGFVQKAPTQEETPPHQSSTKLSSSNESPPDAPEKASEPSRRRRFRKI